MNQLIDAAFFNCFDAKDRELVSGYDSSFLAKLITVGSSKFACNTVGEYYNILTDNEEVRKDFLASLNVSYSEFFRNLLTFEIISQFVLSKLLTHKKGENIELRIWSTACAGGQEAYSMAITLEEYKLKTGSNFGYQIFATDICEKQIEQAQKAKYNLSQIENLSLKQLKQWFTKENELFVIKEELKKHVHFSVFNLLNNANFCPPDSIFCDFDLILCANVMYYYNINNRNIILQKITHGLNSTGYIVTSETERDLFIKNEFAELFPKSAVFSKNRDK